MRGTFVHSQLGRNRKGTFSLFLTSSEPAACEESGIGKPGVFGPGMVEGTFNQHSGDRTLNSGQDLPSEIAGVRRREPALWS